MVDHSSTPPREFTDRTGTLVVVATPIGNLGDITLRALEALHACDGVLAEDTRRTYKLLNAHKVEKPVERLDDHVVKHRLPALLERLREGATLVLVSDAGTPLVSDPGGVLVRAVVEAGLKVESLPGPSAVLTALVVSGLAGNGFRFVGFYPRDGVERRTALAATANDVLPTVFFESPERTLATLESLATVCGASRRVAVCRELTKKFEEVIRGTLAEVVARIAGDPEGVRGEVTVVVEGHVAPVASDGVDEVDSALDAAIAAGMKPSDAAREVARALGLKRAEVYARALARTAKDDD